MRTASSSPRPPQSRWRVVGTAAGVALGCVMLFGAFGKVIDPVGFAELIELHGLDFLLPANVVVYVALGLEIAIGVALLLGVRRLFVLIPAALVVGLFLFLTGSDYAKALAGVEAAHNCGCFGNLVDRTPAEAFWQDVAMLLPTLGLSFVARPTGPLPVARLGAVAGITAASLVFTFFAPGLPLDDFATRLAPDVMLSDICAGQGEDRGCFDAVDNALAEGTHVVVIADIHDEAIQSPLNEYAMAGAGPVLMVVSPLDVDALEDFRWSEHAPSYNLVHAPIGLLRPLYRTLPRSFLVENGRVTRTWAGLPNLDALAATDR